MLKIGIYKNKASVLNWNWGVKFVEQGGGGEGLGGELRVGCGGETFPKVQVMFLRTIFLYLRENFFYKKVPQSAAMK